MLSMEKNSRPRGSGAQGLLITIAAAMVCSFSPAAESATLYVDPNAVPPCIACPPPMGSADVTYCSIGTAVSCAQSGDEIVVAPGLYHERVIIEPKDPDYFELTIRSEVQHDATVTGGPHGRLWVAELEEELGVFTIRNGFDDGPTCDDMRVTIDGFRIIRRHPQNNANALYGKGIDVSVSYDDPDREHLTGLIAINNRIEIKTNHYKPQGGRGGKGIEIGKKTKDYQAYLENQSPMWFIIENNEIAAPYAHGIGVWRGVGQIRNNQVYNCEEAAHLGAGFWMEGEPSLLGTPLDPRIRDSRLETEGILVEHNVFRGSDFINLHLAWSTQGIANNNLILCSDTEHFEGVGLVLGSGLCEPEGNPEDHCVEFDDVLDEIHGRVMVFNNVIDNSFGYGVRLLPRTRVVELHGNILTRNAYDLVPYVEDEPAAIFAHNNVIEYNPVHDDRTHNFLFDNYRSYSECWMEGRVDWNDKDIYTDGSNGCTTYANEPVGDVDPQYWGNMGGQYSYMLAYDEGEMCPYAPIGSSPAVDRGHPNRLDGDGLGSHLPGLGFQEQADAGAYGGPYNVWDPLGSDLCMQYSVDPTCASQ